MAKQHRIGSILRIEDLPPLLPTPRARGKRKKGGTKQKAGSMVAVSRKSRTIFAPRTFLVYETTRTVDASAWGYEHVFVLPAFSMDQIRALLPTMQLKALPQLTLSALPELGLTLQLDPCI